MRRGTLGLLLHRSRREEGQALILTAFALVVLIGFAGIVIDIGRLYVAQRQLQQAVDAAALAAGQSLPHAIAGYVSAVDYSAASGEFNQHPLSMSANAATVTFECLQSLAPGLPCSTDLDQTSCHPAESAPPLTRDRNGNLVAGPTTTCNAVKVTETASVSTTLLHLFLPSGFTSVAASSTAAARGGVPHPLDIMVVLDRTGSMEDHCSDPVMAEDLKTQVMTGGPRGQSEKIDCAKDGVRRLLKGLLPCQESVLGNCGFSPPLDEVGLEMFPALMNPDGSPHSTDGSPNHTDLALELNQRQAMPGPANCAGNLTSRPAWYTPNQTFPGWFLNWANPPSPTDLGYPSDELQTVTVRASGGTFTLSYAGSLPTAPITYPAGASAGTVEDRINALSTIQSAGGHVTVTSTTSTNGGITTTTYSVWFMRGLAGIDVQPMAVGNNLTGTTHTITDTETTKGNGNGTYLITGGLNNDFKLSNQSTTLNPASQLAQAVTWDACAGGTIPTRNGTPNSYYGANVGGFTYYAGAMNLAQAVLESDSARHAQPVIILLSDGDANRTPEGPNPCNQGIAAARAAAQAGTWVYTIAYEAQTTGTCQDDTGITGFQAMQLMAQSPQSLAAGQSYDPSKFYCIPVPAGQNCNSAATLAQVFASIGVDLTDSRLIPDQ